MRGMTIAGLLVTLSLSASAFDLKNLYIGAGLGLENVSSHRYTEDGQGAGMVQIGYDITKNISLEARTAATLKEGDKLDHPYSYGALFVKYHYDLTPEWNIYAFGGHGRHKITFPNERSYNGVKNSETIQSSFSYGIGVSRKLNPHYSLFLDVTHWIEDEVDFHGEKYGIDITGAYFGVQYHFGGSDENDAILGMSSLSNKGKSVQKARTKVIDIQ